MVMVGHHQDQCVVPVRMRPIARKLDRVVEHDGVVDRPLHVEEMRILVDQTGLDHEEKSGIVSRQYLQRGTYLFGQVGWSGNFATVPRLRNFRSSAPSMLPVWNSPSIRVTFEEAAREVISGTVRAIR